MGETSADCFCFNTMIKSKYVILFFAILLPLVVGGVSGFLTAEAIPGWYATLNQPSFNPPNWVFGPVWTTLYLVMGISLYKILLLPASKEKSVALNIFFLQLTLNFFWSLIFFRWHLIGFALVEIIFMWLSIALMIHKFKKLNKFAAYMNIPYLCWVSFASVLNASYYFLNR